MRRPSAEWLLVPVFALPAVVAVAALAWVRDDVLSRLDALRGDGAAAAERWLRESPAARDSYVARLDAAIAHAPSQRRFRRDDVTGRLVVSSPTTPPADAEWVLGTTPLDGLRADGLADAGTRLAVESGTPIARSRGAAAGAVTFAVLAAAPSVAALREADLPASAKLYLVSRTPGATEGDREEAELVRAADRLLDEAAGAPGAGVHASGDVRIAVSSTRREIVAWREVPGGARPIDGLGASVATDATGLAELVFEPRPGAATETLWSGRLDAPLAGSWSIELPRGRAWWRSALATRWILPLAFACAAFIAVPTALLLAIRRRRRLDEARARFVTEIAHDLRTPVAALRLHADLLASGRVPESERRRHEEVVGREAARLSGLLSNLLDLSRLERGTRTFSRDVIDVADVVRESVREFSAIHTERASDVTTSCADDLAVIADRAALSRVLANLLDNAGKFTDRGTPIRVRAEAVGDRGARVVIEDDGPGIRPADRARVFEPWTRGEAAATTAAPGTGLGLALVRDLVRGMGGSVSLRDSERGAAFEVILSGGDDA